ncbi:DUF2141 domain-containing protein [Methylobacterium sp. J-088]|uniref:DUF2141 domain-containing protein n=1 Tax=unclassified Methylobacterium TaxID=2615210 RepID=UPI001FB8D84A|nr:MULTISPECIES: DUF2141 domain-containing protein [unclassified Methylobacterium]MCJ2065786.1 DUF2141 domain-containing protein [Methylobacterium sp. J-088]
MPGLVVAGTLCATVPATAATVQVEIDGIEPGGGPVRVALCQGSLAEAACARGDEASASAGRLQFTFQGVPTGTYAVAAYQDANGNGRLDRTGLGLPLEPYGFSGVAGRRARPDFAEAAFSLREPGGSIRVRLARALPRR